MASKKSATETARKGTALAAKGSTTKKPASKKSADEGTAPSEEKKGSAGKSKTGTFNDLLSQYDTTVGAIAGRLRQIVYEELPDAEETVWIGGWRLALYKDVSEICGIGPMKQGYCNFYLTRGSEIADPDGLLEGKGKGIRHMKVRSLDAIPENAIRRMIREGKRLVVGGNDE